MNRHNGRRLGMALLALGLSLGLGMRTAPPVGALARRAAADAAARPWAEPASGHPLLPPLPLGRAGARTPWRSVGHAALLPELGATAALSGTPWTQQAELTSTAQTLYDSYGWAVAVSGNTAVVGASDTPYGSSYGAVYIFARTGSTWSQQAELLDPQYGSGHDDQFGYAVALQGTTLVVGAINATGPVSYTGAAYVYERNGSAWTLQATLTAADAAYNDGFGAAVAISGTTIVVGDPGKNGSEGAAYVFVRSGGTWTQQAELLYPGHVVHAEFGWTVAVSGDTAVVGAPLAPVAFLYARTGTTWRLSAVLYARHAPYLYVGTAVALAGDTALVSAYDGLAYVPGAVDVFGRTGTRWMLRAVLRPPAAARDISFGYSVALSGQTAVVGGDGAFVYVGSGGVWTQTQLIPGDRPPNAMGAAVAVWGNTALIGATGAPPAGFIFVRAGASGLPASGATGAARATRWVPAG